MSDSRGHEISITVHPAEHSSGDSSVTLASGGCCCCCCCCLHTIGGLIGAIAGSTSAIQQSPRKIMDPNFPFPFRRDEEEIIDTGLPPTMLYWLLVSFLIGVTTVWPYLTSGLKNAEGLFMGLFIAFMILPGLQLGASVLAVIVVALFYPDREPALRRIGKITWWSFAGGMIGMIAMGGFCGMFKVLN